MNNTINDIIFKNKYLKYKKKYLRLKYLTGGKKLFKNIKWINNFNNANKSSFILFFNIDTLTNKNTDDNYNEDIPQLKSSKPRTDQDINVIINKYSEAIKSHDYDKKTIYIINDSFIFNNLALFKYVIGNKVNNKYHKGYIVPWLELINFNISTVEKKSTISNFKGPFLKKLNKFKHSVKKNKLNINNKNLIKSFNFNNYQTLLQDLISIINITPNNYINNLITITNEYNLMSTKSVILNGLEEVNDDTSKQQYQKTSKPMEITNWIKISNVKYNNKNRTFSFNILAMDPLLITPNA